MSVFVDTSALYGLLVRTEEHHAPIAASFRELLEGGRVLITTNYVIVETVALLQHRFGLEPVRDLRLILPTLRVRWVTEDLHRAGLDRLLRADRRRVSLVDCVSFCVMDAEGAREALALDRHFEEQGYRLHPDRGT